MGFKRMSVVVLTCLLMLSAILAGCSGSKDEGKAQGQAADQTTGQGAGQANGQPAGDKKPFEGQKLSLVYMSSVYADAARAMIPEFEQATGAKVEVADVPFATLHEKELLDLTSNTGIYDVISVASQWDGEFAPFVEPLEPYIGKDSFDTSDFIENLFNNSGKWQGQIMGIPNAVTPDVMTYRTDLIDKAPTTWEEYYNIAKKFNDPKNGMYGISIPASKGQVSGLYYIRLWTRAVDLFDENWQASVNTDDAKAALVDLKKTLDYADPASLSWGLPESINAFLAGQAVFCEAWPTLGILQAADDPSKSKIVGKWALAPFPGEKTGATALSAWDMEIPKGSKNKDLAWEWIKMYTSKEKQNEFYNKFQILSPRKSFWEQDSIKNSNIASLREPLDRALMLRIPAGDQISSKVKDGIGSYMSGEFTLDKATGFLEDGLNQIIKDTPPSAGVKNDIAVTLKNWVK